MQKSIEFPLYSNLHYTIRQEAAQHGGSRDIAVDIINPKDGQKVTVRLSTLEQIAKDGVRLRDIWRDHR